MKGEETETQDPLTRNENYRKGNLSILTVKQDAYNVLSVLRSYVNNISGYSATSNIVPILGADVSLLKTNEQKVIKKFKKLASIFVPYDSVYLELEHLQPFFDVFSTFDTRHVKLIILCVEALSNLAKNDLLCFEEEDAEELINKVFSEVLNVFGNVIELKEDYLLLKIFDCFEHLYRSYYGNLVNSQNTSNMIKLILSLLSIRNRNSFFKKVFYSKVTDVLMSAFGDKEKYAGNCHELKRRINTVYLFISLLSGISSPMHSFGYYPEDSYLYISDRDTMLLLRTHLNPILNSLLNVPANFNEFSDDLRRMSLTLFNTSIECEMLDLSNLNLVPILQSQLTHSLYKLLFTDSITMYSLVLRSFWNLYVHFRFYLKSQVELFLNHLISSLMKQPNAPKRTRLDILEMNMEFLEELSKNPHLLLEMFLNFDCDIKCSNLFALLVKCLSNSLSVNNEQEFNSNKLYSSKTKKGTQKTNVKKTSTQYKSNTSSLESIPQLNLELFSLNILQNIVKFTLTDTKLYNNPNPNNCNNYKAELDQDKLSEKEYKDLMMKCSQIFNESKTDEWIYEAKKLGVLSKDCTEKEIAMFLKYSPELDMKKVGEYLATHKNAEYMDRVRENFCKLNHFAGMPIVMAIRTFLSSFRLPGESQQIERLIEIFSKVYFKSQPLACPNQKENDQPEHISSNSDPSSTDELKLARWVVQEDFYFKHKAIQQLYSDYSSLNSEDSEKLNSTDLESMETHEGEKSDHSTTNNITYKPHSSEYNNNSNWTSNSQMYNYFLSNDMETLICHQNYRKICEYLKNTPVTMETQTTIHEATTSIHDQYDESDTTRTNQSSETNKTATNSVTSSTTNVTGATTSSVQLPAEKVRLEHKPGFAYIQDYNAIFVLCYSIIMLNTDLHNHQIKNKMKLEDFIRNNRGTNDGKNFSTEFLQDIYKTIKFHEIKLHSSLSLNNSTYYEPYLWSDYVLQRQKKLSPYVQLKPGYDNENLDPEVKRQVAAKNLVFLASKYGVWDNRLILFDVLLKNNLLEVLDQFFMYSRSVDHLKKTVQLFWLIVRFGLKYNNYDLVNKVFQLPSIDVGYSIGYKCQISISFILNVLALCSSYFDKDSWSKSLDIVTRFYCLNLLPPTFAALDGDPRLFSNNYSDLSVPSIRFKRITDKKSGWLVGFSNLMPFAKGSSTQDAVKSLNKSGTDEDNAETFLFLFDVQLGSTDLVQNKFFDVYLLRNKFSPVYSSEDEATINNVTKTLSSESDREELLPPILTYINLRLAFLNIYKLDDLFMGAIINTSLNSFRTFLSVVMENILNHTKSHQDSNRDSERDSFREKENFGNILDPNYVELDRFGDRVTSIFNLGIFSRLALQLLTNSNKNQTEEEQCSEESEEKKVLLLTYFVEAFYRLSQNLVVKNSFEFLPSRENLYSAFHLPELGKEMFKELDIKTEPDDIFSNYVTFILLNLVFWFIDYYNNNKDMGSPITRNFGLENGENGTESLKKEGRENVFDFTLVHLAGWLLQLFVNFDNKFFNLYIEPLEKLLYNLADSTCISKNYYLVSVILCIIQRMVNPYLPFGGEPYKKPISRATSSILTLLLRRSKCISWNNSLLAKLTTQTLLSIALHSNTTTLVNTPKPTKETKEKPNKEQYTENLLAIQLLIEFDSFAEDDNKEILEHLWLLSVHSLSIIFSIGPSEISNEAMKGLNKLLLQQPYPSTKCTFTSQISRIFDYILSPMITLNFCYPLPNQMQTPLDETPKPKNYENNNYRLCNPFQDRGEESEDQYLWMSGDMSNYLNNFAFKDFDDLASRKATATNLICHAILSKITPLITDNNGNMPSDLLKTSASNLECLLYDHKDLCENNCVKRLVTVTQYVLNVIIPSNGEIHTGLSRDTYLETLKNFILVLLTSPELKTAPESCRNHFKNDAELVSCLELLEDQVTFESVTHGEYVLSSLLAHTFSSSDSLKTLFLEVLKVVFPKLNTEPTPPNTS